MILNVDKNRGLVKVLWKDVSSFVSKIEPTFAGIVDKLDPDKSCPLYLAYYPYGAMDADTQSSLFPNKHGKYYRISDSDAPKDIKKHLGYSKNNSPMGMVLEKEMECFVDLKKEKITIPWLIYTPGKIFPFAKIFNKKNDRIYMPNGLLSSTAGARSAFILPNIGCSNNHSNLQRDFNVRHPPPKSNYDHWFIFKEILNNEMVKSDWRCCVMYFSEKWIEKINNDKSWGDLKHYLHELAWYFFEYERNLIYYDTTFAMIQRKRNLKLNPYLADTAKHLLAIAMGARPGYVPITNEDALPYEFLQNVIVDSYALKKYLPTIMQPKHFIYEKDKCPSYYSLQNSSTGVFSPKSREASSTLYEIRELERIMKIYIQELSAKNIPCSDTVLGKIAKVIQFDYFHNKQDRHRIVRSSGEIAKLDHRFSAKNHKFKKENAVFAADAAFLRGCISLKTKD